MKATNKNIYLCCAFAATLAVLASCSYSELPPKTDDATTTYVLPKGEVPTAAESTLANEIKNEYNEFLNK